MKRIAAALFAVLLLLPSMEARADVGMAGRVVVAFRPCAGLTEKRRNLSVFIGLADFSGPYYRYQRTISYSAMSSPSRSFDLAFSAPTGIYEMFVSVADTTCTSQNYVTVLAGHTRHIDVVGVSGSEEPVTVAAVAGTLPRDLNISIVALPNDAACGANIADTMPALSYLGSIEDDAYYVMVPVTSKPPSTAVGLKVYLTGGAIFVRLPLRYPRSAPVINGKPTFSRYDLTAQRIATVSKTVSPGTMLCPPADSSGSKQEAESRSAPHDSRHHDKI